MSNSLAVVGGILLILAALGGIAGVIYYGFAQNIINDINANNEHKLDTAQIALSIIWIILSIVAIILLIWLFWSGVAITLAGIVAY